jgi:hypothetical protein
MVIQVPIVTRVVLIHLGHLKKRVVCLSLISEFLLDISVIEHNNTTVFRRVSRGNAPFIHATPAPSRVHINFRHGLTYSSLSAEDIPEVPRPARVEDPDLDTSHVLHLVFGLTQP